MNNNDATASALEHVDVGRRGFLRKLLAGGAAVAALPATSTVVFGKGQQGAGKGKGGARDPAKMAAEMIKTYDKDGDGALNDKELTAALTAIAHRHGKGGGKGKVSR
jgi:hypothetical protein